MEALFIASAGRAAKTGPEMIMHVYVEFLSHLPQFQYDPARDVAINLINGSEVCSIKGRERFGNHAICIKWPGSKRPDCHVDGGKYASLQISIANQLKEGVSTHSWAAQLIRMVLEFHAKEIAADAAAVQP